MKRLLPLLLLFTLALGQTVFIKAPAIASDGQGVITALEVEVREGRGRTLVTTEPLIGVDTQNSEKLAVQIAQNITGVDLTDKDIIFTFFANVSLVDGPSAGAAMTVATIAALDGKQLNENTVITGTIEPDGRIGTVGGILKKAKAVSDIGVTTFIIPKGQKIVTEYVKRVSNPSPGIYIETEEPVTIDIASLSEQWGLRVVEAETINEALPIILGNTTLTLPELQPVQLNPVEGSEALRGMAEYEISRARSAGVNVSTAEEMARNGYYYTAANDAFQQILQKPAGDSIEDLRFSVKTHLEQTRLNLNEINRTFYYQDDIEWLAAAEQRYIQALNSAESKTPADLLAAEEWLALSDFSLSHIANSGDTIDSVQVQVKLANLINEASRKSMVSQAIGDPRSKQFLDLSVKASEQGYQLGALNLAADSIAVGESANMSPYVKLDEYLGSEVSGNWAEAYMDHARYMRWLSSEGSTSLLSESLYYAVRASMYSSLYTFVSMPAFDVPQKIEILTEQNEILIAILGAYLLSMYAVYEARKKKGRKKFIEKIVELKNRIGMI